MIIIDCEAGSNRIYSQFSVDKHVAISMRFMLQIVAVFITILGYRNRIKVQIKEGS